MKTLVTVNFAEKRVLNILHNFKVKPNNYGCKRCQDWRLGIVGVEINMLP